MGYTVRTKRGRWYVQLETYPEKTKRVARTIKGQALANLGIRPDMPLEHVKLVLKDLNRKDRTQRWDAKRLKIEGRLEDQKRAFVQRLPAHLVKEFEEELSSFPDTRHVFVIWRATMRMLLALDIPLKELRRRRQAVYNYFETKKLSSAYAKKIIPMLNRWGEFFADKTGEPFSLVPLPTGHAKGRIRKAYEANRRQDKASDGLTSEILAAIKNDLPREQHNWLFVSLWFGLRPQEMRNLGNPSLTYFSHDPDKNVELLNVKQTKLSNLPEDSQWKGIPILYPEQRLAAEMIRKQATATPLPKTIQRYTKGNHKLYAGRKGFGPLMWDKGHDIVEVSSWLGHKSIDRTYMDYMRWQKLKLRRIA